MKIFPSLRSILAESFTLLLVLPLMAASSASETAGAALPSQSGSSPSLDSQSFLEFLRDEYDDSDCDEHIEKLNVPVSIDSTDKKMVFHLHDTDGNLVSKQITFFAFSKYHDFAFVGNMIGASIVAHVDTLEDLLSMIDGVFIICTPKYLSKVHSALFRNIMDSLQLITDYSNYRELANHKIPTWFFHCLLMTTHQHLRLSPMEGTSHQGGQSTEYSVAYEKGNRTSTNRYNFTRAEAFCFYACNIKRVDPSVFDYFFDYPSSREYMDLLEPPRE